MSEEKELREEYREAMVECQIEEFGTMSFTEWKEMRSALDELGNEYLRRIAEDAEEFDYSEAINSDK